MIATTVRWDAVDVTAPITNGAERTAKACGPDVAVLASTHLEAIASRAQRRQKSRSPGRARYKP